MRDYGKLLEWLRSSQNACYLYGCDECPADCEGHEGDIFKDAADAIEELVATFREIAAFVIHYADEDEVSAEVLCRKLHKIGLIEKGGAWRTLPEPPKEDA